MLMAEVPDELCADCQSIVCCQRRYGGAGMAISSATELRVAVLGAGGTIAPAILADLAASDEGATLVLLALDGERARAAAERHGGAKAASHVVDARDPEGLARALSD